MPRLEYTRNTPFRIGIAYAVLFSLSAALLFGVFYWSVTRQMTGAMQESIEQDTRPLIQIFSEGRIGRLIQAIDERTSAAKPGESVFLLQTPAGRILSGNVAPTASFTGWRELGIAYTALRGDPEDDEILALGVDLDGAFLLVGRSLRGVRQTQTLLLQSLAWTIGGTVILALAGGILLGRGALRRIEAINRTTQAIIEGDLSRRIPAEGTSDEIGRLAGNINRMLDRIEELMLGLQHVTNDIAHDLQTPLGRLRQTLETAHRRETTVEGHKAALDKAIDETNSILDTFGALLRIAQIETGARKAEFTRLDLTDIVASVAEIYQSVAEDEGLSLTTDIGPGIEIHGDRDLLTQMIANLVENAIRHCPRGTDIGVSLILGERGPVLTIADNGPGIPAEEHARVLQRFYRLEQSRTTPGSGLGLALVRAIAELHGAALTLSDNRPGLRVDIRF
jgi:signal transduction histidine kinase